MSATDRRPDIGESQLRGIWQVHWKPLPEVATLTPRVTASPFVYLNILLWILATNAEFLRQHSYSLIYVGCKS